LQRRLRELQGNWDEDRLIEKNAGEFRKIIYYCFYAQKIYQYSCFIPYFSILMAEAKQIGEWEFWPIYEGLKWKEAEDFLMEKKTWEMKWAYTFEKRPVDLVWGHYNVWRGIGIWLAKIVAKHPEVLWRIQQLIDELPLLNMNRQEVILGNDDARAVIRLQWNGEDKRWLMTAYDLQ